MKKNRRFIAAGVAVLTISLWSIGYADEMVIRPLGKVNAMSTNGNVQLELFYVAASTNRMAFDQYWVAKPNSHQALVTSSSNNIVDWGDRICGFVSAKPALITYSGVTNIPNPMSVEDIRQYFTPVFERFHEHKDLGIGMTTLLPEELLPKFTFGSPAIRTFGFHIKINKITVTSTNVTLALQGERAEVPEEDKTNNVVLFTFGKDLNLIETKVITNAPLQTY